MLTPLSMLSKKHPQAQHMADIAKQVSSYIETQGIKLSPGAIAKYTILAIAVIYGLRKASVLGRISASVVTGAIAQVLANKLVTNHQPAKVTARKKLAKVLH